MIKSFSGQVVVCFVILRAISAYVGENWLSQYIFWGCYNFKYFFGVLEIPDIYWGWTVDAGFEPTYAEKNRVPPPPPHLGLGFEPQV